ncbi:MAG TPA: PDZ domain-containing protein [Polyangia bacterium]|jgi:type II secretory pathway component PulC|nr:PDZ domain-containing protein [Polyangia bacterium]
MRKWLLAIVFCGCATASPAPKGVETAADSPAATSETAPAQPKPAENVALATRPPDRAADHTIGRREIDAVLAQSPGYFLQHVETKAQFRGGHFHGWRLIAFFPGDNRFSGVDLQAGDVVTSVNGKPIEQPDQFMAVWTALRSSSELTVDVERDGTPHTLRWQISEK